MAGTKAAIAHIDQVNSFSGPVSPIISFTIRGLGAVAVINIAEVIGLIL